MALQRTLAIIKAEAVTAGNIGVIIKEISCANVCERAFFN